MSVGKENGLDGFWVELEGPVAFIRFGASTLEKTAFHQDARAVDFQQIL
jgi:hypothetical protein